MLREQLPALSFHFGIRPADLDHMTVGEIDAYLDALDDIANARSRKG